MGSPLGWTPHIWPYIFILTSFAYVFLHCNWLDKSSSSFLHSFNRYLHYLIGTPLPVLACVISTLLIIFSKLYGEMSGSLTRGTMVCNCNLQPTLQGSSFRLTRALESVPHLFTFGAICTMQKTHFLDSQVNITLFRSTFFRDASKSGTGHWSLK